MLKAYENFVPKGEMRKKLNQKGRINYVQLSKSMTAAQVSMSIKMAFRHLKISNYSVLSIDHSGHFLYYASIDNIDGLAAVSRRGALYLCEVE